MVELYPIILPRFTRRSIDVQLTAILEKEQFIQLIFGWWNLIFASGEKENLLVVVLVFKAVFGSIIN